MQLVQGLRVRGRLCPWSSLDDGLYKIVEWRSIDLGMAYLGVVTYVGNMMENWV